MRGLQLIVVVLGGVCWLAGGQAQQRDDGAPSPDLEFLEYLGAWAEDDDEWLAIEEWHKGDEDDAPRRERKRPERERKDGDESE